LLEEARGTHKLLADVEYDVKWGVARATSGPAYTECKREQRECASKRKHEYECRAECRYEAKDGRVHHVAAFAFDFILARRSRNGGRQRSISCRAYRDPNGC
jgi:hypothetical protein